MTKKEENPQNSNTSFKIKLTKINNFPGINNTQFKVKLGEGLYQKYKNSQPVVYGTPGDFSMKLFEESLQEVFMQPQERKVKIVMNEGAKKLFDQALMERFTKNYNKNEYRKGLSFKSKIFKQTYKFG